MIELHNATKRYDSLAAVDNVSFSVNVGEYFALLGPNGAGKTTIVKMVTRLYPTYVWKFITLHQLAFSDR